ncbi:hypothetical protein GCM10023065_28320 [Microbacterium laevaniformans]|uniref:hypothetical protein n=1 Tax=Microbacterium laevaniformans TaxID=36807 RepID=UPI0019599D8B|nr:hypothetical protein [Microbacterium laevaniformans]MBM7753795.1 hypothetical protein [Microbacterium laevaniformans]GLJ64350.1 hypothetical protein GCM10017578_12380 [Microbacterium laevaniformans]
MSTAPSLLIDLAGVARLAGVQRPVASMWRSRFASSPDPFPRAINVEGGRACFEADHRPIRVEMLPDGLEAELIEAAERGEARRGEGSVEHVEVFRMVSVGTSGPG